MYPIRLIPRAFAVFASVALLGAVSTIRALEPQPAPDKSDAPVVPAQAAAPALPAPIQPAPTQPAPTQPAPTQPAPTAGDTGTTDSDTQFLQKFNALVPPGSTVTPKGAEAVRSNPSTDVTTGGANAGAINASDVTQLLLNSDNVTGVQNQQRNPTTLDPRIRGFRPGEYLTYGDGGYFFPARIDLDTALSKFNPTEIQDVIVIKGPYSVRYGPGFSFLDLTTFGAPISTTGGYEVHGVTQLGFQTNGRQWDGLQSIQLAAPDFGVRFTYDIRTGQDYTAGNGQEISSQYNVQNFNFAGTIQLSNCSTLEFKALESMQHDLDFPGLYFDLSRLETQAYSIRYRYDDPEGNARGRVDFWYNYTSANGDTSEAAKQAQDDAILTTSFLKPGLPVGSTPSKFLDFSTTNFDELIGGYRGFFELGRSDGPRAAIGTDLNIIRLHLAENILIQPLAPIPSSVGIADPYLREDQSIPESRSIDPGLFVDGSLPIGERFTLHGGIRVDFVDTSSDDRTLTGNVVIVPGQTPAQNTFSLNPIIFSADPNDPNLQRHFTLYSSYLNGDYKIDDHLTARIGIADAQTPPTLTELYAAGPFVGVLQQGISRIFGDPHLSPETNKEVDIGLSGTYDRLRLTVNGFYSFIDNYITYDQNKAGAGINQVVFTNTDEATLAGGEAYVEFDLLDWLTPFGSMSYVQGEDLTHIDNRRGTFLGNPLVSSRRTIDTEPLPGIPPLELRGGFRVHQPIKSPKWSVEFLARSVMGQDNIASSLGELPTSGFTIFDIRAFWQINSYLLLSGGVENIGDKLYQEALDPRAGNFVGGDPFFRPGTNFYVSARLTY